MSPGTNPSAAPLPGIGDIFDTAWRVFQERWGAIVGITLLVDLPLAYVQGALFDPEEFSLGAGLLSNLLALVGLISAAAIIRIASDRLSEAPDASWTEALTASVRAWPRLVLTALLVVLLILGGTLLLVIPGLILAVQASFVAWVVVLTGTSGMTAFRASRELVRGVWWRTLWRLMALTLPTLTVALIMSLPTLLVGDSMLMKALLSVPTLLASTYYLICVTVLHRGLVARRGALPPATPRTAPTWWSGDPGSPATPQP